MNLFDILGPVMVGPSSSHTAGAVRLGRIARRLLGEGTPCRADITLFGSFAATGCGHGTDRALIAGLLGFQPDDERIAGSFGWAEKAGLSFSFATSHVGGDGEKMRAYVQRGKTICGDYIGGVIAQALEMGESNACMKCIVAAPTAGSCGVLPAVLLPYQQREGLSDEAMVRAMYVAGAIGQVVAAKASIAGAAGGCQAEIGTASAMGAAALCYLGGGDAQAVCHAAAIAIKAMLGLVCDPIAGLVEVPCVKRNAAGAVIAMSSADMALAGIRSAVPPDEVILAMREVGDKMDVSLKETGVGGVAGTPFGQKIAEKMGMA